jgi:phosphoesterase RecJ-like protein
LSTNATIDWSALAEIVARHERFVLTSHVRPDADAVGSELGLAGALKARGKHVRIVNASRNPPRLACLDPDHQVLHLGDDVQAGNLADAQVVVVLDTSAWQQLGAMADVLRNSSAARVVIDHHLSGDDLGATEFKDTSAAATGELVVQALEFMGVEITPAIAEPLFAAIATDTGWFRFRSADSETFAIAARLVDAGARPARLYQGLYEEDTLARLRLMGVGLSRVQSALDGRVVYTEIHRDDFQQTGAKPPDTEELVNFTLTVAGAEVGLIFIEQPAGGVKVSLRSRSDVDCRLWAEQLGGGGHRQAAGAILPDPLSEAIPKVLAALPADWNSATSGDPASGEAS